MPLFRRGESASTLDLLVVGLGNPGRKHARDRHNVGFMVVDELARRHGGSFRGKFSGHIAEIRIDGRRLGLLKPDTYMNDSGRSVQPAVAFYKAPLEHLLVVHDEVDLAVGRLQARLGGGLAGHNGLRSIAGRLGSPEFLRLRVGVGRPGRGDPRDVADFVLAAVRARGGRGRARHACGGRGRVARRRRPRRDAALVQLSRAARRAVGRLRASAAPASRSAPADRRRAASRAETDVSGQWKPVAHPAQRRRQPVTKLPLACL